MDKCWKNYTEYYIYGVLFYIPQVATPETFIYIMLLAMCFYTYYCFKQFYLLQCIKLNNKDVIKIFHQLGFEGTIGFIVAMWITNLTGDKATEYQFYCRFSRLY
jgi:NHS family xanthosine MFS transporter